MNSSKNFSCCLICSILSSLSNVNCCSKHLSALHRTMPAGLSTQIVYMMPSNMNEWSQRECQCQSHCSKPKRRYRSRSSNSSSSSSPKVQPRRKKRSVVIQSIVRTIYSKDSINSLIFYRILSRTMICN